MRVIVTRPAAQAADWVGRLKACGVRAMALPLIRIAPAPDDTAVDRAWQLLQAAPTDPARPQLVMFVSANAVQQFMARAPQTGWPEGLTAAATGPGTAAALQAAGVPAAQIEQPDAGSLQFDSEALWTRLASWSWQGRAALVVRGEAGRNWFAEQLQRHGARVDFVVAYQRLPPQPSATEHALLVAALQHPAQFRWHFSSSEAVANLLNLARGADWSASTAAATHPRIAAALRDAGFGGLAAIAPTPQAVADWLRAGGAADPSIQSATQ